MGKTAYIIIHLVIFIGLAPLLSGLITRIKNNLRMRKGQNILQPYFNLIKLFGKGQVISETASWIFKVTPFVVLASTLTAALLVPLFIFSSPLPKTADLLALIFIFALGRFFLTLAAIDTGSSFGGMGSSREMFISSLAEPVLCLVIFSIALQNGSTNVTIFNSIPKMPVTSVVTAITLFLVIIAETSRIPVDNQETHLELTMIHEAMCLEYSGRSLGLLELAAYAKQMIWFFLVAQIIFPAVPLSVINPAGIFSWGIWYGLRILAIIVAVALMEIAVAKMRLFRVADYLGFAFVLGIISAICASLRI